MLADDLILLKGMSDDFDEVQQKPGWHRPSPLKKPSPLNQSDFDALSDLDEVYPPGKGTRRSPSQLTQQEYDHYANRQDPLKGYTDQIRMRLLEDQFRNLDAHKLKHTLAAIAQEDLERRLGKLNGLKRGGRRTKRARRKSRRKRR